MPDHTDTSVLPCGPDADSGMAAADVDGNTKLTERREKVLAYWQEQRGYL